MSEKDFLDISDEELFRIAHYGPQSERDKEMVRIVFEYLSSQSPRTVGALDPYIKDHAMTVAELLDLVSKAPPYLDRTTDVGAAHTYLPSEELHKYKSTGKEEEYETVWTLGAPEIKEDGLHLLSPGDPALYNTNILFTTYKQHTSGYADRLSSLYGFSCLATKAGAFKPDYASTISLRELIMALQNASYEDPKMPVFLTHSPGEAYETRPKTPVVGVCWVEEDDTVILRYSSAF